MSELTTQQKTALDEMLERRMSNANETYEQAKAHLIRFFEDRIDSKDRDAN